MKVCKTSAHGQGKSESLFNFGKFSEKPGNVDKAEWNA